MRTRILLLGLAAALSAVVVMAAPPASAQSGCPATTANPYPPSAPSLTLSTSQVFAGDSITVSGTCFTPNGVATVVLGSARVNLGTAQTNAAGSFSRSVTIPANTTPGLQVLAATDGRFEQSTTINVLAQTTGPLPRTGATFVIPFSLAGAALIAVGTLAVMAARRKRAAAAA